MRARVLLPQPEVAEDAFYEVGFMNQADDLHFMGASGTTEWVHFPDLFDELRQVLDGTRRGRWSDPSSTVTSGVTAEDVGSSPGLKGPALILSPLFLLE